MVSTVYRSAVNGMATDLGRGLLGCDGDEPHALLRDWKPVLANRRLV